MNLEKIIIENDSIGKRLDVLICEKFAHLTRNFVQNLIKDNCVFVNNKNVSKHYKVRLKDIVTITFKEPEKIEVVAENIPIEIIYEDDDILIVNKKRGMVVHPAPGNYKETLVNALMFKYKDSLPAIGGVLRPGIVHRIDKNTTGLLAVAKTNDSFICLSKQIKEHSFERIYVAVVHGKFREKKGIINFPIGRSLKDRKKMAVNLKNGKYAVTKFEVLEEFKNFSYLKLKLETGRTHQIRVHMHHINHPIVGDDVYGVRADSKKYNLNKGQCLHSKKLEIFHNKLKKRISFEVEPDEYFLDFLNRCQNEK